MLLLLLATLQLACAAPSFWFATGAEPTGAVDFRGCFGNCRCVYVAATPLTVTDRRLAPSSVPLYAVIERNDACSFRTGPFTNASWYPVPAEPIHAAPFDASPLLRSDPSPIITELVGGLQENRLKARDEKLASYHTRNSFSREAVEVADFLLNEMVQLGCQSAELHKYRADLSPNVHCVVAGTGAEDVIVVGAHYDSRSTGVNDTTLRAPGADDNGSGTAALLDILQTLLQKPHIRFQRTIVFVLFSGEEQGLLGSQAFVQFLLHERKVKVNAMVNMDMIGYPERNAPTTIFWKATNTNKELTALAMQLVPLYIPSAKVSTSNSCCSDQQSFHAAGIPAAGVFESIQAINNPNYHKGTDLPSTVDFSHVLRCAQSAAALMGTVAVPATK